LAIEAVPRLDQLGNSVDHAHEFGTILTENANTAMLRKG
jgi:hypothetical protein